MSEFTGERVIPGQVNEELWAEHLARYVFAARFATGRRALDIGCGTGYGSAELARRAARVVGVDNAAGALAYAREHFTLKNLEFLEASASALPVPDGAFDLVVAFEVIEHLENWRGLLMEAKRALAPGGLFVISTPNKTYYAESRGTTGPNPFHAHEFEFAEFSAELRGIFGEVTLLAQNRTECFVFDPWTSRGPVAEARVDGDAGRPEDAHFFIALCGGQQAAPAPFAYVPSAANLLRERERHIALLEGQLKEVRADRRTLIEFADRQKAEIEERNRWALELDALHKKALQRVAQLQEDYKTEQAAGRRMAGAYDAKIAELEAENQRRADWGRETEARLTAEVEKQTAELVKCVELLDQTDATLKERTAWALDLDGQLRHCHSLMEMARASRWVRLGNTVGLGPKL